MSRRVILWSGQGALEEPTVNLTPLIDVVFVILITFIVIAPLLEQDRVELAEASASSEKTVSVQKASALSIHVREDNSILFNGRPVTLYELTEALKQAKAGFPEACPQVFHDKKAHFGTYQSIKNAVEAAGFQEMDVILHPSR